MKVVWSWLLELVDLERAPAVEEGARALTGAGLEIEAVTDLGASFSGVVVAEVVASRPHPEADKLTLVHVVDRRSGSATEVVCGAPNVPAAGRKVLWAQPGAGLPGGVTIATRAVKGVTSAGMLCSEVELGVGDDDSGIVVLAEDDTTALGAPAQRALGVDDWVLEVNVPANRGDCLGHLGVARELAALFSGRLAPPVPDVDADELRAEFTAASVASVAIADEIGCPRYTARVVDGVTVRPSPRRFAQRLRAVGVRPVSNLVDVTNYAMFELGQPLHAFDATTLRGGVNVRRARAGERLTTLDGVERTLEPGDVLICDQERPVALGGVMGGLDTEVTDATRRILLEAASFEPISIRRTARRLGLHSEASHRFERGVDPELADLASARAATLLARLGGGRIASGVVDVYPRPRVVSAIPVRLARVAHVTGVELDGATCRGALERLGFSMTDGATTDSGTGAALTVTPPSARTDVTREVDVIEEILRVVGYDRVPSTLPALREAPRISGDERPDRARRILAAAGLGEAITFGFQSRERLAALRLGPDDRRNRPIALRNPMSADQAIMRTSLLPNLLAAIGRNRSFGVLDVALFEVGSVFLRRAQGPQDGEITDLADEPAHASAVLAGRRPQWLGDSGSWDFFDAKGLVEALVKELTGDAGAVRFVPGTSEPFLHPGVSARLELADGTRVGWVGEVHPSTRDALGIDVAVFAFDLALMALPARQPAQMQPIPRFPGSSRDVSLLLAESVSAAQVRNVIEGAREPLVQAVSVVEEYRGAQLPVGHKSMLWSITYRSPERTLTDAEVDAAHEAIVQRLLTTLSAQRR